MNNRQVADLASLHRVQDCLDFYAAELGAVDLAYLRGRLDASVGRLEMAAADQAESQVTSRSNARHVNELRERLLLHHLAPIVEFARSSVTKVGQMQTLKLPADDVDEQQFVFFATGTANGARACREEFVKRGLPPGFVEELEEATARYSRAIRTRDISIMVRDGAGGLMRYEFPIAWEIVRLMGVLIKRDLGGNRHLIGAWQQARLHAPRQEAKRLRAPEPAKLLQAGGGPALIAATSGGVVADQAPAENTLASAATEQQRALPAGPERHSLVRRVFRLFGDAA